MTASVTPASTAISLVVAPSNPLRENTSSAVSINCCRRSVPCIRILIMIVSEYLLACQEESAFAIARRIVQTSSNWLAAEAEKPAESRLSQDWLPHKKGRLTIGRRLPTCPQKGGASGTKRKCLRVLGGGCVDSFRWLIGRSVSSGLSELSCR